MRSLNQRVHSSILCAPTKFFEKLVEKTLERGKRNDSPPGEPFAVGSNIVIAASKNAAQKSAGPEGNPAIRALTSIGIDAGFSSREVADQPPEEYQKDKEDSGVKRSVGCVSATPIHTSKNRGDSYCSSKWTELRHPATLLKSF
jgi:hypothetical protein